MAKNNIIEGKSISSLKMIDAPFISIVKIANLLEGLLISIDIA